jgi:putative membrane protein
MHHARTSVLLGVAVMALTQTATAQQRATGSGIRVTKSEAVTADVSTTPSTTTVAVSSGDVTVTTPFDLAAYANMNEKNITAHMAAGDSLEIQLSQLAQSKGTSQQVRDFGAMLLNDHTAHLAKTHEIISDEDVGAEALAFDPEGMRMRQMLTELRSMSAGTNWDAAFLRFQATHHQNEIDLLTANIKNAHDDDLEDHIEKSLVSLAKHRDAAKSIGTSLGLTF